MQLLTQTGIHNIRRGCLLAVTCLMSLAMPAVWAQPADDDNLDPALYRDRLRTRVLSRVQEDLEQGETARAVETLQKILDMPDDLFVWDVQRSAASSFRTQAQVLISQFSDAAYRTYLRMVEPAADALLDEAHQASGPGPYQEVVRRFLLTPAGFTAADRLASRALDRGEFDTALRIWEELWQNPRHRDRFTTVIAAKAASAAKLSGRGKRVAEWISRSPARTAQIGGQAVSAADWTGDFQGPHVADSAGALIRWSMLGGDPHRNRREFASAPFLNPTWQKAFGEEGSPIFPRLLESWAQERLSEFNSLAVANFPVVVDNRVYYRDSSGVQCLDLKTGQVQWHYPCRFSVSRVLDGLSRGDRLVVNQHGRETGLSILYTANSVFGSMSADSERLYVVDGPAEALFGTPSRGFRVPNFDAREVLPANQLLALPLNPGSQGPDEPVRPIWTVGGPDKDAEMSAPLAGHSFRGPPLVAEGRLFVLTEFGSQVNLVALAADTGKVLWQQGLAYADGPTAWDALRPAIASPLAYSAGIVVCPTDAGVIVGYDSVRGQLLWSYVFDIEPTERRRGRGFVQPTFGDAAFPEMPLIHAGRVVLLSRHSDYLHCIDLETGSRLWRVPRSDAEYVGTVTDAVTLIVGRQTCRGLSTETGEELWSSQFGMPSGVGLATANQYLLPLQDGRVVTVDLRTGRSVSTVQALSRPRWHGPAAISGEAESEVVIPGNLIPAGDQIVSAGLTGLAIFPQSEPLLAEVRARLRREPDDQQSRLLATELEMTLGDLAAARQYLEPALTAELSPEQQDKRRRLHRELLYAELDSGLHNEAAILAELAKLADSPSETARFLVRQAESQLSSGDVTGLLASASTLAGLDSQTRLAAFEDESCWIAPTAYAADLLRRLRQNADSEQARQLEAEFIRQRDRALTVGTADALQQFLTMFGTRPEADAVRVALARKKIAGSHFQAAELLLYVCREHKDSPEFATATVELVQLYDRLGLHFEAAQLLHEGGNRFAGVRRSAELAATERLLDRQPTPTSVRLRPSLRAGYRHELTESFSRYRRRFILPHETGFHIIDKGDGRAAVIDRQTGVTTGYLNIPMQHSFPSESKAMPTGHFIPIGGPGEMLGVSLLELVGGEPVWRVEPSSPVVHSEAIAVGPAGLTFCTFQSRQALYAVDPMTGQLLWERRLPEPDAGLASDPYAGLIGDDQVLVLFEADRRSYIVYRTTTGEVLKRGVLDLEPNQTRRVFGRKLLHVATTPTGLRARIWDPLTNRLEFDEPVGPRVFSAVSADRELVVVLPPERPGQPGRLQVRDVERNEIRLEVSVSAAEMADLNYIRVFRHFERYYINLQRPSRAPIGNWFSYYANDTFLSAESVQGDLLAVDATTGEILWRRQLPQRSVLRMPFFRPPFLVAFSRIRDRWQGGRQALLVEIIDPDTGQTLAQSENIFPDRIVHAEYEPQAQRLTLFGLHTEVEINFSPTGLPTEGTPL